MNTLSALRQILPNLSRLPASAETLAPERSGISSSELSGLSPVSLKPSGPTAPTSGSDFSGLLGRMVSEVNAKQQVAGETLQSLQTGQGVPIHQAMIAMEEASVSFQLMVEVRNKLLESYQELMRMQV